MRASEIRQKFLTFFADQQHVIRPSASLVPADDPTLLFVNAGMVPFKKVFLGMEDAPDGRRRATTAQKCVRAGGKHNDLEQVGHTARHHTFFEMLGNFSFGDYFKRDAIAFAWDLITSKDKLAIDPSWLRVTVHHSDDEAAALWQEIAGLSADRVYRLGDKDNFWQMADTGPCGPCTEIFVDLSRAASDFRFPAGATGEWTELDRDVFSQAAFEEGGELGRFLEIWNLVFMQFDKQPDGTLVPLPKPSVDTGAGLERIAAVKQGVTNNFHTDVFSALIKTVEDTVGFSYWGRESGEHRTGVQIKGGAVVQNAVDPASFRVLADHARAVAFLLADGVFPSNEGRGYVLRRILRRGVRHAYLLGRREPTLVHVVQTVIDTLGDVYPELRSRAEHLVKTTRVEEQAFLATIEGGLTRFEQLAPTHSMHKGAISGDDAFKLYDTFGFPIDLTELMAHERGYTVDIPGFEAALGLQRTRSKDERKTRQLGVSVNELGDLASWEQPASATANDARFVGYDVIEVESEVVAIRHLGDEGRVAVLLRESPFYAESGGQVSDHGEIVGKGWRIDVDGVKKVEGRSAALGRLSGEFHWGRAMARVPSEQRRDTERNHTATHLMHAALRQVLGDSVHQAGSLVAPDRLRFDFTHHGPVKAEKLVDVESIVNREIWRSTPVSTTEMPYPIAREKGAMALFGEKYGDVVRVVDVPGFSMELCGGTHVRNTSEIGLFVILSETGVASGVRRIEALTGPAAFAQLKAHEATLVRVAEALKSPVATVERRVQQVLEERRALEKQLHDATRGGGDELQKLIAAATSIGSNGAQLVLGEVVVGDVKALQAMGDALREQLKSGVGILAARLEDGKGSLLAVVTDDLRERGIRADAIVRDVAAIAGGRGGGKPHMAQAGIPDASRMADALAQAPALISAMVANA